jgi:hypothetical protein
VKHIRGGLEIVNEHRQHVFGSSEQHMIPSKHLIQAFARLERQLYEMSETPNIVLKLTNSHTLDGYYKCSVSQSPLVTQFEAFDEAWRALDCRWHAMYTWLAKVQKIAADDSTISDLLCQRSNLLKDFSDWKLNFERLKTTKNVPLTQRERCISASLDCHITLAMQILKVATEIGEMSWDRYVEDFEQLIKLCCSVVAAENSSSSAKSFPSFPDGLFPDPTDMDGGRRKSAPVVVGQRYILQEETNPATKSNGVLNFLDMGILPISFHIVRYCRDARIRLRTINLLEQHPRLEGIWNSLMVARLARSLDAIERQSSCLEDAAMRGASAHEIALNDRVSKIDISFGGTKEAHLIFYKAAVDTGVNSVQIRETIAW